MNITTPEDFIAIQDTEKIVRGISAFLSENWRAKNIKKGNIVLEAIKLCAKRSYLHGWQTHYNLIHSEEYVKWRMKKE